MKKQISLTYFELFGLKAKHSFEAFDQTSQINPNFRGNRAESCQNRMLIKITYPNLLLGSEKEVWIYVQTYLVRST